MKHLILTLGIFAMTLCSGQTTCLTATPFPDNSFVVFNPPVNWVELYYTFQAPQPTIDFSFTAFSAIQSGTALCPSIDVIYTIYDQNCFLIETSTDGSFNNLVLGANYIIGYNANCLQAGIGFILTSEDIILPVTLLYATAETSANGVNVIWATATELNCSGFQIDRGTDLSDWRQIGFIEGSNNSQSVVRYTFLDSKPVTGVNYYRLTQYDVDGRFEVLQIIAIVWQQDATTTPFRLFNLLGQKVAD